MHNRLLCLQLQFHTHLQSLRAARSRQFWIMIQQIETHEPKLWGNPSGLIAASLLFYSISVYQSDFHLHLLSPSQSVTVTTSNHFLHFWLFSAAQFQISSDTRVLEKMHIHKVCVLYLYMVCHCAVFFKSHLSQSENNVFFWFAFFPCEILDTFPFSGT